MLYVFSINQVKLAIGNRKRQLIWDGGSISRYILESNVLRKAKTS
jgi:hypothetical protein